MLTAACRTGDKISGWTVGEDLIMKHGRNIRKERLTRFRILILTGLFLILSAASVYAGTQKLTVKVTAAGKEIQKTIRLGEKLQLVVKNGKKTVSAGKVSFASSKKKVVSVSKKGVLTAKKAGTAVITVQYKKKQAKITVSVPDGPEIMTPNGAKTIKNYLLGAFIPVGKVLYVWGGGWTDATRKGISSTMKKWYNSQDKNYNYLKWNDLSAANRAKGFDCSGYVGWCTYQVMHTVSNEGNGYTCVSGEVGGQYKANGWGSIITQKKLASKGYVLKAGDIGFNAGHVFIVLGQCRDKSVVVLHSTPPGGVQLAGTSTPDGKYGSQAIELAKRYMSGYAGTKKYPYNSSFGNAIPQYRYFRWKKSVLADPDGYMNKYADEILADLFGTR